MSPTRRTRALVALLVVVALGTGTWLSFVVVRHARRGSATAASPSIVFILTDDQRWDTIDQMPQVESLLVRRGITFQNAFVDDSLCCPSRSSILTGNYVSHTGVWTNKPPLGGFPKFHDASTVATWLHAAGYHTALFGKYLNRYQKTTYIPPGWDRWLAFSGELSPYYYDYRVNDQGHLVDYGDAPSDYSTDVLMREATQYIRSTKGPLFVYIATAAPHTPTTPAPQDLHAFPKLPAFHPPSYDERDVSDKPAFVRNLPPLSRARRKYIRTLRRHTYQSLLDVDRMVSQVVSALAATGRLHNTMIVFTSDNGFAWGEHRWVEKVVGYEESIRVPLVIRYDPLIRSSRKDDHLVVNIDFAPTFGALGAAKVPTTDGRSLLPLIRGQPTIWRDRFMVEAQSQVHVPSYCELRTERYAFIEYATGERELYDLSRDPFELDNIAGQSSSQRVIDGFREQLRRLCNPPPPTFHLTP